MNKLQEEIKEITKSVDKDIKDLEEQMEALINDDFELDKDA